jgi:hypothetical protein
MIVQMPERGNGSSHTIYSFERDICVTLNVGRNPVVVVPYVGHMITYLYALLMGV